MADYYYPTVAGKTYIYRNTVTEFANGGNQAPLSYVTSTDTLRTLGYQGYNAPDGSPVYAFSVTYRVCADRDNKDQFKLYYVTKGNSSNGGFITGNDPRMIANLSNISSVNMTSASIDTILYAVEGPARDVIDGPGPKVYRTDVIYFTAKADIVNLWWNENGAMRQTRLIWDGDFVKNEEWSYASSVGDPYTLWEVSDVSALTTTPAGTFSTAKISAFTSSINTPTTEYKWWGRNTGLVSQYDEWRVTNDGQNFRKKTKLRELISIQ
jgi:hypothetical protein